MEDKSIRFEEEDSNSDAENLTGTVRLSTESTGRDHKDGCTVVTEKPSSTFGENTVTTSTEPMCAFSGDEVGYVCLSKLQQEYRSHTDSRVDENILKHYIKSNIDGIEATNYYESNSLNNTNKIGKRREKTVSPSGKLPDCRICGDKSAGFHYGAFVCVACKVNVLLLLFEPC